MRAAIGFVAFMVALSAVVILLTSCGLREEPITEPEPFADRPEPGCHQGTPAYDCPPLVQECRGR